MKTFTRHLVCLLLFFAAFVASQQGHAQSILNPGDTVKTYNAASPPTQPAWGTIGKWVRTVRLNWNTTGYKCYIYESNAFRLYFPKSYNPTANDGKKYPMMIFMHGVGEGSTSLYDNEYQLYHGGQIFGNAVAAGTFDGYVLCMQTGGGWGAQEYTELRDICNYMVTNNKLDPFRVTENGLSGGGDGNWAMFFTYPTYVQGLIPMSAVDISYDQSSFVNQGKFTPIWLLNGGLDGSPAPATCAQVTAAFQNAGADFTNHVFPTLGHDTWDSTWLLPNFWPFQLAVYGSNPWTLFGQTQFCPGAPINVTIGLTPGYDAYQWRMNGNVIASATTNSITATQVGTYDARIERGGIWSDWSHTPVVIGIMPPTVTPPITLAPGSSKVIPDLNGSGTVLQVPAGYATYAWQKVGSSTIIGTSDTLNVSTPGQYIVQVTQLHGCSSSFSPPFTVESASGPNKPDPAADLIATPLSNTSILLNWLQNPNPVNNNTGFEVYQGAKSGGPYTLLTVTGQDVSKDTIKNLTPGTTYYYKVRAIDTTSASAGSNEASAMTIADTQPPTAPGALTITGTTGTSIALSWTASTDNIGVTGYNIYVNGVKAYTTTATTFTIDALQYPQSYDLTVKAFDGSGNLSTASNQVSGEPLGNGLAYEYFILPSAPAALPNYGNYPMTSDGYAANVSLSTTTQSTLYGFLWQGYITIPTTGTYNFRTTSVDGSKIYLGALGGTTSPYSYTGTAIVSNDGIHKSTAVTSANLTLTAGVYPIAIAYYHGTSGNGALTVAWKTPSSGNNYVTIPNSAFISSTVANGAVPAAPSNLVATVQTYNKIKLTWTDNSTTETGFEVWRSTSPSTGFLIITTTGAGVTSYTDSTASASTRYYYEVRAIGQYGQSSFSDNYTEAYWQFNNNYNDSSGNGHALTAIGSPVFDATTKVEGAYSLKLNGTSQAVTISNSGSFLEEHYSQRTIAFWMQSSSNTGNRVIVDIGGSTNGLALVLNSNTLYAAADSGGKRTTISTPYTSTGWSHIALVYSGSSLLLYVNGVLATSSTSLPFASIQTTTDGARIGENNGTNAYNTTGGFFSGWIDAFGIYNSALGADAVNNLMNFAFKQSNGTTQALPAAPSTPYSLAAAAVSSSQVNVSWTDSSALVSGYQLYRSVTNDQNYVLIATLPGNVTSYSDASLFPNAVYYYKVTASNVGGTSAYASEVSATTKDVVPVITNISNQSMHYGVTTVVPVSATSSSAGTLTLTAYNLPPFASFTDNGNRTGTLTFNPTAGNQGNYTGLSVIVTDAFGGADTTTFNLSVNNFFAPTIDTISNYTIKDNDTLSIPLVAVDQNAADTLTISASGYPSGSTVTQSANGSAVLFVHPSYAAAGTYNIQVTAKDNNGLSATRNFTLTVNFVNPNVTIYTRASAGDAIGAPWNSLTGATTTGLLDANGNTTTVGVTFAPTFWWGTYNGGPTTGNNSGVYPDAVLKDYYYFDIFGGPDSVNGTVTGLDPTKQYNLTFYAGSVWSGAPNNGTTTYSANGQTVLLPVQGNTQNTVTIGNITPASGGTIPFVMNETAGSPAGFLNALVITQIFDDGTAPVGIGSLTANNVPGQVHLNWIDSAYNATGYEVWRSPAGTGNYSLLNTLVSGSVNYADSNITGNTAYTYRVRAINGHGTSPFDSVSTTTLARSPKINAIANVALKNNQQTSVNVTTVDDSTARLTLTVAGLPPFATFTDNGNGTGVLNVAPTSGTLGVYPVTITATDQFDSTASTSFTIAVTEPNVTSIYVNFSDGAHPVPAPWNTMAGPPFAGTTLSNLTDDSNNPTTVSVSLVNGFQWFVASGMQPNNGHNIYPDSVLRMAYYDGTSNTDNLKVTGLNQTLKYNFVFFASHDDGQSGLTNYTINGQTVTLQATDNINKTVQINNISPDNTGSVTISVAKASTGIYSFLSSLVIQSYDSTVVSLLNPTDLRIINAKTNSLTLQWQDRSFNETGFEIWRANDSASANYSLITTVGAGVTSYKDSGLSVNKTYYYLVRATRTTDGTYSQYSNTVSGYTYNAIVDIAFTPTITAPTPWNNLNGGQPQFGAVFNNFLTESGVITDIGLTVTSVWSGLYPAGQNPGNNSGIYPDSVLINSYGLFPGVVGTVQLNGLDQSKVYDLTFFASSQAYGDVNATYTVNGKWTILNAAINTNGITTLYGLVPDQNGNMNITVALTDAGSTFGLINALVVQGYTPSTNTAGPPNLPAGATVTPVLMENMATNFTGAKTAATDSTADKAFGAYPNPFKDAFTLVVPADDNDKVMVSVYNVNGVLAYRQEFDNLVAGSNNLQIIANQNMAAKGVYIARVVYANSQKLPKVIKVLKQ